MGLEFQILKFLTSSPKRLPQKPRIQLRSDALSSLHYRVVCAWILTLTILQFYPKTDFWRHGLRSERGNRSSARWTRWFLSENRVRHASRAPRKYSRDARIAFVCR